MAARTAAKALNQEQLIRAIGIAMAKAKQQDVDPLTQRLAELERRLQELEIRNMWSNDGR